MEQLFVNPFASFMDAKDRVSNSRMNEQRNAMLQTQFDQQQAAMRLQQAEKDRLAAAERARFNFRTQRGYAQPQAQPMRQASQMASQMQMQQPRPMQGGAPIDPQGPEIDPASGREIDMVTVQGQMKPPMPSQEDEVTFLLRDAYTRGDVGTFNQLFDAKRQNMSDQEKMMRQQSAAMAGQILQLPPEQRAAGVMQMIERLGVDPQDVAIDDYVNDPSALERALRFEMVMGSPDEAMKANIGVSADREKQINEQRFAPVSALNLGNEQLLYGGTGDVINRFRVGVSPNTTVTAGVQRRGQDISAATTRRGQNMTDARADRTERTNLPPGFILNGN